MSRLLLKKSCQWMVFSLAFMQCIAAQGAPLKADPKLHATKHVELPLQSSPDKVSLAFVGDIMLAETPGKMIARGHDPFTSFASLLRNTDIRVGNLECVVATTGSAEEGKPYTFRAHPRVIPLLKKHFDAVGIANNHTGDFGPQAFSQMLTLLQKEKLPYFGGGQNLSEAHRALIIERKGLKIALLAYDEFFHVISKLISTVPVSHGAKMNKSRSIFAVPAKSNMPIL